tara:strand:+ start:148 stop:945 length:798 start_codon:yes stop_codon:yes gene_type:complete
VHVNEGKDGTVKYLKERGVEHTFTRYNAGICEGLNKAAAKAQYDYILYGHDDFYFCPGWDEVMMAEIKRIGHNNFYLSGFMLSPSQLKCGDTVKNFDEKKLLKTYKNISHSDFQGSTWAPSVVHKDTWHAVGGLSEEFFPGFASDPDFNMKLWQHGVRIFRGLGKSLVYHFGSVVLRKKNTWHKNARGSENTKKFLYKWRISVKFFRKHYLKADTPYDGPLIIPVKNFNCFVEKLICKLQLVYLYVCKRHLIKAFKEQMPNISTQ